MGSIKPIAGDSVQRIHAGQVVLELQQALKELVENSLDAGATSIEVRIKDHGKDGVEVVDNGSGISEEDWPSIGLKHHTSKLPNLAALPHVTTFGFRGEALSALCALCESVTVVTATKETAPLGAIIKLGKDGKVEDCSGRVARPRGTTITLSGLFATLPVRRKEFERTAKREYTKALTTLTSYALVPASVSKEDGREGVRLKVESVAAGKNGKRNAVITTDGRGSLRSSVISVWGPKSLENVLDIELELDVDVDRLMAKREGLNGASQAVKISGLISSAAWGQGRSSPDRQFYYINGRPVDLPVVAKAVNEVYRSFNTHQLPLVILDFSVPRESVDINVSPDKRSIFLHSEGQLVETLKSALEDFFQPSRSSFAVEGASQKVTMVQSSLMPTARPTVVPSDVSEEEEPLTDDSDKENEVPVETLQNEHSEAESDKENEPISVSAPTTASSRFSSRPARSSGSSRVVQTISTSTASWSPDRAPRASTSRSSRANLRERLKGFASQSAPVQAGSPAPSDEDLESEEEAGEAHAGGSPVPVASDEDDNDIEIIAVDHVDKAKGRVPTVASARGRTSRRSATRAPVSPPVPVGSEDYAGAGTDVRPCAVPTASPAPAATVTLIETPVEDDQPGPSRRRRRSSPIEVDVELEDAASEIMEINDQVASEGARLSPGLDDPLDEARQSTGNKRRTPREDSSYREEISSTAVNGEMTLAFDIAALRERKRKRRRKSAPTEEAHRDAYTVLNERGISTAAGIANKDITSAGEALSRVISKADFADMEVLGQFNKGFIIARLQHPDSGADDLFIVDQHATDEKYNFETLQRTTVIKAQTLIRPRPLQLTAGDELVAIENLDILHSNGFEVEVDEDKAPGRGERISLTAMPVSKETTFDFKDLEQLLHLLSDGSRPAGQMVRCTKARAMFAMRACRKSVMIGKSLTKGQMVALLRNMGTIDQPWNCPHGRPTMRHLTKLDHTPKSRGGRIDWASWSAAV